MTSDTFRFAPDEIFAAFNKAGVEYVVIGGLAAVLHGSPLRTGDADICPRRDTANLERLGPHLRPSERRYAPTRLTTSPRGGTEC